MTLNGRKFRITDIHVVELSREKHEVSGRARESAHCDGSVPSVTQQCLSADGSCTWQKPDIHLLSETPKSPHRRLSWCSLPVPKQYEGSLQSLYSFAQSAIGGTWQ